MDAAIIRRVPAMEPAGPDDHLVTALRRHFGHRDFRGGQREVVEAVLAGRDAVVVMPTGGGKSLCYQLPAVLGDRPTVVVSPLIALMKDQVDALRGRGIAAVALNSTLEPRRQRALEQDYLDGVIRLLYVAPERLVRPDLRALLAARRPGRIVVDEAHCISEWGHDFRRDYLRIGEVAAALGPVQVIACTATATPAVRDDIAARLHLRDARVFVHGFARENLFLAVRRARDEAEKLEALDALIDPGDGHAIVYAGTRSRAAAVAGRLATRFATALYHADVEAGERAVAQERFARGDVRVVVATSAFGMGVDVPTVRQVVHVALPSSLEEYYQQAGRAGRDGLPARCDLVHAPADRRLPEFFIEAAHPDAAVVASVYRALRAAGRDPGAWRLLGPAAEAAGVSDAAGDAARDLLIEAGVIDGAGHVAEADPRRLPVDHGRVAAHRRLAYERFGRLLAYVAGGACRHRLILDHFGEAVAAVSCGDRCDVCAAPGGRGAPLESLPVRQALSAVARLNGSLGAVRLAAVLRGSRGHRLEQVPGACEIPTFGALSGWGQADVVELLRRLVEQGALREAPPPYPTLSITRPGIEAMRGDRQLAVEDPRRGRRGQAATPVPDEPLDPAAAGRLTRLRAWRTEQARRRAVPAYIVFADRVLLDLARRAPATQPELLAVPGVGPGKLALYGTDLLAVLASDGGAPAAGAEGGAPGDARLSGGPAG